MHVLILAAGEGKRLRPYTLETPKCLVEVDGVSLLEYQIRVLRSQGISDITMVGGYKIEKLRRFGCDLVENTRYFETNMVWSLFCGINRLRDEFIVSYGDIVYSPKILKALLSSEADISVVVDLDWKSYWSSRMENPLDDAESMKIDDFGRIVELGQPPQGYEDIQGQYIGLMKFSSTGAQLLKNFYEEMTREECQVQRLQSMYFTDLLNAMIQQGIDISAVTVSSPWVEVDTVSDLHASVTRQRLGDISRELSLSV